jgi:hypothetical protein
VPQTGSGSGPGVPVSPAPTERRYASYAQAVTQGPAGPGTPPGQSAQAAEESRKKARKKVSYARTMDDHEVDELVHRLFDHLVPLLKNEIVHDRERSGRRRDSRH